MDGASNSTATIKYCALSESFYQEVEDLVVACFITDENSFRLCRNCEGGQPEDHRPWIGRMVRAHSCAVSRLAIDTDTGRVVGACLNDVRTPDCPGRGMSPLADSPSEACRAVTGFFQQIGEGYDVYKALGVEKVVDINIGVVDRRYRRRGISLELRRQSIEMARQAGCQAAVDWATSPYTRKALDKLGFETERYIPFTESVFTNYDKIDMSDLGPEDGWALMFRRL